MKLDDYALVFTNYPWLTPFKPFEGWGSADGSTRKLEWFDAYNATKHDRESSFSRATLGHVFEFDWGMYCDDGGTIWAVTRSRTVRRAAVLL